MQRSHLILLTLSLLTAACAAPDYDVIISNGVIYDGNGADPYAADVGINADTIAFIGDLSEFSGALEIDTILNSAAHWRSIPTAWQSLRDL